MAPKVIDADGHVVEPLSAWASAPAAFRPRIERDAAGFEHVIVGGQEIVAVSLGLLGTPGSRMDDPSTFKPLDRALPGGMDPVQRLADMDTEGIDAAILYPSVGLNCWALEDAEAAVALARAYNDWLASYCDADRSRLYGAAMVPLQDPQAGAAELRRAHDELGFPAAFVRPNPCRGRVISDRSHEVVWETAEKLGVAIGIHEGSSVIIQTLGADRPFNPLILHTVSHAFEQMLACAQLIAFGVMERHPGLRFVFLEAGGGWAPYWLERMDEQVHGFGGYCPEMRLLPSEYFARQCWISFEVDEPTLPALVPFVGLDRIVWGSDYPHHDSTFPGAVKELRATLSPLAEPVQARILGANAAELYRL
jgi:predicted TIM-barrel fold metal-dependent hydrolase